MPAVAYSHVPVDRNEWTRRLRVALIDSPASRAAATTATPPEVDDLPKYSNRVSSVNARNYEYLRKLAPELRGRPFRELFVWDRDDCSPLRMDNGLEPMGFICENRHIADALWSSTGPWLGELSTRVKDVHRDSDTVRIATDAGELECALLLGADGRNSIVRRQLLNDNDIPFERSYDQMGIVATLLTHQPLPGAATSYQRFLSTGPIALLPLDQQAMSMVWTLPTPIATRLLAVGLDGSHWRRLLQAALTLLVADMQFYLEHPQALTEADLQWRTRSMEPERAHLAASVPTVKEVSLSSLSAFPLSCYLPGKVISERALLLGDAAHTVHPLAGQGLNLGLADVRSLEEAIGEAARIGSDLGLAAHYEAHERARLAATAAMAGFIEAVHRIYGRDGWRVLRQRGMRLLDQVAPLKRLLVKLASQV